MVYQNLTSIDHFLTTEKGLYYRKEHDRYVNGLSHHSEAYCTVSNDALPRWRGTVK